jgi:hypothetical protein
MRRGCVMTRGRRRATVAVLTMLLAAGVASSAAAQAGPATGPVYAIEGAWYGIVTISGVGPTPSLDTFTSNAQRHGVEGTFLCTIPAVSKMPNPFSPSGWVAATPAGHGNWVRLETNTYAFTAVRSLFDQNGSPFGWARFWGTITPVSDDEYTGTMNAQYYLLNGTPLFPANLTGTMHSHRIQIEQ